MRGEGMDVRGIVKVFFCSVKRLHIFSIVTEMNDPFLFYFFSNIRAADGNLLEGINLAISKLDKYHLDRDLTHTGKGEMDERFD